ncbi:cytoplasmic protein [Falsochrobactrum shanghaiense]|uniref:Cytoplasmic protein n=1 Tax=Falsochrobactrum shanghaiense TaxID=2201899 RepID=A0A316JCN5_9HYPH|nr:cytoplasmic protein [Falsochrobactrum shanghaiense]PWL19048.1 cytoplasmic protein [Falsochrobactrum shanghaiense]
MEIALRSATKAFLAARAEERMNAMQRVALQIIAGIDMDKLQVASREEKRHARGRISRLIKRERLKGVNGHWSYDLNRHIALKQALDRLGD